MRIRTAKQRAQRIDLDYFKHSHGLRRWRILLSIAVPAAAILWIGGIAAAGSRKPYSAGPVSRAHAFAEARCEMCHRTAAAERTDKPATEYTDKAAAEYTEHTGSFFRRHTTDGACLACHDAPAHAANQTPPPACSTCHRDHQGRVELSRTDDRFCVECHGDLRTTHGDPKVTQSVEPFPSGHPEFAVVRQGATDPGRIAFNHAVHLKDTLRGPNGSEKLACGTCHTPEIARPGMNQKRPASTGLMAPITYRQQCARCHPLFFDERVPQEAPHDTPEKVRAFLQQSLAGYIRQNPKEMTRSDNDVRRVPLNFPRPVEAPARTPQEWVARHAALDERMLWSKTCAVCHDKSSMDAAGLPIYEKSNIPKQWMPRAAFDHRPHAMVTCESCHAARGSTKTSDVLLPNESTCAACHAPAKGAEHRCFECHRYHDWTKAHPVPSAYTLTDFK
jgi:predicted CXXCH cytochrome family protein